MGLKHKVSKKVAMTIIAVCTLVGAAAGLAIGFGFTPRNSIASNVKQQNNNVLNGLSSNLNNSSNNGQQIITISGTSIQAMIISKSDYGKYEHIQVETSNGKKEILDATKHPVFFMAYWCPHCHAVESAFAVDKVKTEPDMVSIWYHGKSMQEAVGLTKESLAKNGVQNYPTYYQPNDNISSTYVLRGTPTLVMMYKGQLIQVIGEIQNESDWKTLLGTKK